MSPIDIGRVHIEPGDYILGDRDGVLAIPQSIAEEVITKAEAVVQDRKSRPEIDPERHASGRCLPEIRKILESPAYSANSCVIAAVCSPTLGASLGLYNTWPSMRNGQRVVRISKSLTVR